ncbi:hypothetical protein CANCADRAFT_128796 [Tortispora caseinolytica NRRL Y-17796]|uniref:RRM domain-containing protein n=1 Tax=Tortispora caseinolytica NRRL Y-17796 TaxID=767744 RepID=A0A1E4TAL8_9ASCO|nr:hypothetical protein CANCADRAFT_128796 [Tortispora caseinolytica NRRL Y-17796]
MSEADVGTGTRQQSSFFDSKSQRPPNRAIHDTLSPSAPISYSSVASGGGNATSTPVLASDTTNFKPASSEKAGAHSDTFSSAPSANIPNPQDPWATSSIKALSAHSSSQVWNEIDKVKPVQVSVDEYQSSANASATTATTMNNVSNDSSDPSDDTHGLGHSTSSIGNGDLALSEAGGNSSAGDDDLIPTAIVIKNIPFAIKKEQLLEIMMDIGLPIPYAFNYHFDNGVFRGLAFANFTTPDETGAVIQHLNGHEIAGRKLRVEYKKMLPLAERERIEREKREKRGQLEEQHRNVPQPGSASGTPGHVPADMSTVAPSGSQGGDRSIPQVAPILSSGPPKPSAASSKNSYYPLLSPAISKLDLNDPETLEIYTQIIIFREDKYRNELVFHIPVTPSQRRTIFLLSQQLGLVHSLRRPDNSTAVPTSPDEDVGLSVYLIKTPGTTGLLGSKGSVSGVNMSVYGRGSGVNPGNSGPADIYGNGAILRGSKSFVDVRTSPPQIYSQFPNSQRQPFSSGGPQAAAGNASSQQFGFGAHHGGFVAGHNPGAGETFNPGFGSSSSMNAGGMSSSFGAYQGIGHRHSVTNMGNPGNGVSSLLSPSMSGNGEGFGGVMGNSSVPFSYGSMHQSAQQGFAKLSTSAGTVSSAGSVDNGAVSPSISKAGPGYSSAFADIFNSSKSTNNEGESTDVFP